MCQVKFKKFHGLGNDFILINGFNHPLPYARMSALSQRLCDRHTGIGADGLVVVRPSSSADFKMSIWNADGSVPEMCGNAIRCLARFVIEEGLWKDTIMRVETLAGIQPVTVLSQENDWSICVDMGTGILEESGTIDNRGKSFAFSRISMGNPHCVIFERHAKDVITHGPAISTHSRFSGGINVEFVSVDTPTQCRVDVWERGAGRTQACGTGACAVVVAGTHNGILTPKCDVLLPGGTLHIDASDTDHVMMTGPASVVFEGCFSLFRLLI